MIKQLLCALIVLLSFNVYASPYAVIEAGAAFVDGGVNKNDVPLSLWSRAPDLKYGTKLGLAGRGAFGFKFKNNHALEFGFSNGQVIKTEAQGEVQNLPSSEIHVHGFILPSGFNLPDNIDLMSYAYYYEYRQQHRMDVSYLYTFTKYIPNAYLKAGVSFGVGEFKYRTHIKYQAVGISGERNRSQPSTTSWNTGLMLGAGYTWMIESNIDLRVGYTLNMDMYFNGPGEGNYKPQIMNHSVTAGIVYKF
jgi:opacity protein-like surface antigen